MSGHALAGHTHPVVSAIDSAENALESVRDAAYFGLSDDDLEAALEHGETLRSRVFETMLALVAEAEGRELGRRLGAPSTAAWLRDRYRMRLGDARRLVQLGGQMRADPAPEDYAANVSSAPTGRELVATAAALGEGAISPEHVVVVDEVMRKIPRAVSADQAAQAERDLAGFCREHDPRTVAKLGAYLLHVLSADALDDGEDERHRRRNLRFDEVNGGVLGTLTTEGMALVRAALDPLAAPEPAADGAPDTRSAGQRLADALVEMARRAIAADGYPDSHGVSHRVLLNVGLDALSADHDCGEEPTSDPQDGSGGANGRPASDCPISAKAAAVRVAGHGVAPGELTWGGAISAAAARRLACFAGIQRVVIDPMGAVLDVGREYRTVTPAQFVALMARDGGCAFPGCTRPASWCIAHHIVHWADGGETNLDNLVLLCQYHHSVVHHRGWDVEMSADRLPNFYPPPWVDPDRRPRRNSRPRLRSPA